MALLTACWMVGSGGESATAGTLSSTATSNRGCVSPGSAQNSRWRRAAKLFFTAASTACICAYQGIRL